MQHNDAARSPPTTPTVGQAPTPAAADATPMPPDATPGLTLGTSLRTGR